MFRGTIPSEVKRILKEVASEWSVETVYCGCSGNFSTERTLLDAHPFRIHSNDVTIYSTAIGRLYALQDLNMEPNSLMEEHFPWVLPYCGTPIETTSTLLLLLRVLEGVSTSGETKENTYWQRITRAYESQWPELHERTIKKLEERYIDLSSYTAEDVFSWIDHTDRDAAFVTYPPFFGASNDYEQQFGKADRYFDWDRPEYPPLTEERLAEFWHKVTEHKHFVFGSKDIYPEFKHLIRGMAQTAERGVSIYLYYNDGPRRVVTPEQKTSPCPFPRLEVGQDIGKKLKIMPIERSHFLSLRSKYMAEGILPGRPTDNYGVFVDDKLIGCFAVSLAPKPGGGLNVDASAGYLLSDFPVAPTSYPRLAKLVLYAALSRESQLLMERIAKHRLRRVATTAFTKRPVSMKYRGLFDLLRRRETEDAGEDAGLTEKYYNQGYELQYIANLGEWTLEEGYEQWRKKHGKKEKENRAKEYVAA